MNPIIESLVEHRSIREYRPDAITEADLQTILHASERASTSGNMQTYSILVTKDADRRATLWEYHYQQNMIKQAPVLLTFCADWNRMTRWCELSAADPSYGNFLSFMVGAADALIAAQNAVLAAESLGLGICYLGTTLCRPLELIKFFELPKYVFPVTTLVIGHPAETPELRSRLPLKSIVHGEKYAPNTTERLRAAYHERETEGWARYQSVPELAERVNATGIKNLAQIYTQLKYTRENNEAISNELIQALKQQGFWPAPGETM